MSKLYFCCSLAMLLLTLPLLNSGIASTHCDFNNDGFDDLAIGVPGDEAVQVLYGRATGLSATNNQFWHPDSSNVAGESNLAAAFGSALACGDFNGDRVDDLAIGAPIGMLIPGGTVTVLYGTTRWRLSAARSQLWTQDSPGVLDQSEWDDYFGQALASGDFNGDGFADLAIGVPGENVEYQGAMVHVSGAVQILYGSANGLSASGNQFWTQSSPGIAGDPGAIGAQFGAALAAADFGKDTNSDCYDDLAIGRPYIESIDPPKEGAVYILFGTATGLSSAESELWNETVLGTRGPAEEENSFGRALAAGYFGGTQSVCGGKIADLIVGAPRRTIGTALVAGAAFVIYGSNDGLTAAGSQMWHQGSPSIAENPERVDFFGAALATGRMQSGRDYLAIGVLFESVGNLGAAGVVHVLYTDPTTSKVTASGSRYYNQNTPGVQDWAEKFDRFGNAVATGDFNADGQDDLVISSPLESIKEIEYAGIIHIFYGGYLANSQMFHQNSIDIKDVAEPGDSFGMTLSQ